MQGVDVFSAIMAAKDDQPVANERCRVRKAVEGVHCLGASPNLLLCEVC